MLVAKRRTPMRKASRKRKRKTWPTDGALRGVPPLIAELARRFHQAYLARSGARNGVNPGNLNTYHVELATRGWIVDIVNFKKGRVYFHLCMDARRASNSLALKKPSDRRLSAHEILALTRAGKINERRRKARLASRRRRRRALTERGRAAKKRI